jgi:hypothetical protein
MYEIDALGSSTYSVFVFRVFWTEPRSFTIINVVSNCHSASEDKDSGGSPCDSKFSSLDLDCLLRCEAIYPAT